MLSNLKPFEIFLIIAVIVLLFGAKKLPDMARALGKSARILKSEAKAMKKEGETEDGATTGTTSEAPSEAAQQAPRTIQAAPGDVSSSRPVAEPNTTNKS
ncbi:Sec-independent protein translocase subunit TatA [Streptomyces piniterrae]|uniref:Sec-independent protein translocase protein TatA n=1 Tax=Streptomyces piniterrae TaxID=2571125 RepID=A0A4U0MRU2_9ACTN|nr:Sec-independent protein translocase subunit TatA [Streptomyces piniterrae]TJZ43573.1 Sec-independent protein translocase subunit TatA [Streptomyces piniterrae]